MDFKQSIANDESGINSLSGFAYQIRVFIYYMSRMNYGDQIEFETLEDVTVNKTNLDKSIDHKSGSFSSLLKSLNEYNAIQVKRTKIGKIARNQILFNWLILESRGANISQYTLYTENSYENKGNIFDVTSEELYESVMKTDKGITSSIGKVKSIYENEVKDFQKAYESIKSKYQFISEESINTKILEGYTTHFRRHGLSEIYFNLRVKELIQYITGEIMQAIYNKEPYICNYADIMQKIEDISERIKQDLYEPDFNSFKKINQVNLSNPYILKSREYLQLLKCKLNPTRIEEHLVFQQYYEDIRYRLLEDNKLNYIENIESTTYDNYCSVKEDLEMEEQDSPRKRLLETKKMSNYYAKKNQTRHGSCIYLTKDDIDKNKRISWGDENE